MDEDHVRAVEWLRAYRLVDDDELVPEGDVRVRCFFAGFTQGTAAKKRGPVRTAQDEGRRQRPKRQVADVERARVLVGRSFSAWSQQLFDARINQPTATLAEVAATVGMTREQAHSRLRRLLERAARLEN